MIRFHHRLKNRILIVVLPLMMAVLFAWSFFYYNLMKDSHLDRFNEAKINAESNIVETINLIDAGNRMLEMRLEPELAEKAKVFKKAYEDAGGDVQKLDVDALKRMYGNSFEFFVIDEKNVVIRSSTPIALGFDFSAFSVELGNKISNIREGEEIWFEQLRTDVVSGKLNKFVYIPTADNRYLLEVAYSVGGFNAVIDELKPDRTISNLIRTNGVIKDIALYDMYGYKMVDDGTDYEPTPERLKIVEEAKRLKAYTINVSRNEEKRIIYVGLNDKRQRTLANTDRVIEITYDKSILNNQLDALLQNTFFIDLFIILLLLIVIGYSSGRLTKPIEDLKHVSDEIAKGNYGVEIKVVSEDEVGELAKSFGTMIGEINSNFKEIEAQKNALKEYNKNLEMKVQERTHEIAAQNDELHAKNAELEIAWVKAREAIDAKGNFLAMISHEIRTPINGVIGMAYLLQRTSLTARQQDYLDKIRVSGENLLEIINDVLDISKLEAGMTELEHIHFSLEEILELVSNQVAYKASEKNLELVMSYDPSMPDQLVGDPMRLRQVLANLLNNAVKFTPSGEIHLNVEVLEQQQNNVKLKFTVKDTGIGIDPVNLNKLFTPFQQADDSVTRKYGGTGLGLSICKHFINLMNGDIWVESELGVGSSFHFTVEMEAGRSGKRDGNEVEEALASLKVLVVDDSDTIREVMVEMLKPLVDDIDDVASGEAALALIDSQPDKDYDIILMDWRLTGMDGVETAYEIKRSQRMHRVPAVLMLTGYDLEEARRHEKSVSIDAFLSKPIIRSSLLSTMVQITGTKIVKKSELQTSTRLILKDPSRKMHILVAEDNAINQQIAREMIEQPRIQVDCVENGEDAVYAVTQKAYDLVLMDVQMPECDGLEATKRIRGIEGLEKLPIIAMTAHALEEDRIKCLEAGMDDYLSKPINDAQLFETIAKWVDGKLEVKIEHRDRLLENIQAIDKLKSFQTKLPIDNLKGNWDLYLKLLKDFRTDFMEIDKVIDEHIRNGQHHEARKIIHGIRGITGNLGAIDLYVISQALEMELSNDGISLDNANYTSFKQELRKVLEDIAQVTEREPMEIKDDEVGLLGVGELFKELEQMLKEGNPDIQLFVPAIQRLLGKTDHRVLAIDLVRHIENYDFDKALEILHDMEGVPIESA